MPCFAPQTVQYLDILFLSFVQLLTPILCFSIYRSTIPPILFALMPFFFSLLQQLFFLPIQWFPSSFIAVTTHNFLLVTTTKETNGEKREPHTPRSPGTSQVLKKFPCACVTRVFCFFVPSHKLQVLYEDTTQIAPVVFEGVSHGVS